MIIAGRVIYSMQGWVTAQLDGRCCLCRRTLNAGDQVIRVSAQQDGRNWAGTCCADTAEDLSGHWLLEPNAPRHQTPGGA